MSRVLVAGATGYLGRYIVENLNQSNSRFKALVRSPDKLQALNLSPEQLIIGEVTRPSSIQDCCDDIDVVISCIGITRQRDGLSYMDVDYQANLNLLSEAKKSGVKQFIYVSVLKGDELKALKICQAKEQFVEQLHSSDIDYTVIRPNGFFSDMSEFIEMAAKGRIYLFGDGNILSNPIHGADLAEVCIAAIGAGQQQVNVGGPQLFSHREIAELAFHALNKRPKITYIPDYVRRAVLFLLRKLTSVTTYGPLEFFLTVMARDMVAPRYGTRTLATHFKKLAEGRD